MSSRRRHSQARTRAQMQRHQHLAHERDVRREIAEGAAAPDAPATVAWAPRPRVARPSTARRVAEALRVFLNGTDNDAWRPLTAADLTRRSRDVAAARRAAEGRPEEEEEEPSGVVGDLEAAASAVAAVELGGGGTTMPAVAQFTPISSVRRSVACLTGHLPLRGTEMEVVRVSAGDRQRLALPHASFKKDVRVRTCTIQATSSTRIRGGVSRFASVRPDTETVQLGEVLEGTVYVIVFQAHHAR